MADTHDPQFPSQDPPSSFNQWESEAAPSKKFRPSLLVGILIAVIALVGLVLAIGVGVGVNPAPKGALGTSSSVSATDSDQGGSSGDSAPKVEYIVTAEAPVKINFSDNLGDHLEKFNGGKGRWTKRFDLEEYYGDLNILVTKQTDDYDNPFTMTCEIKLDGKTVKKSDGEYAVSCNKIYYPR